jgi:hypothetical protein
MVRERILLAQKTTTTVKSAKKLSQMDALQRKQTMEACIAEQGQRGHLIVSSYGKFILFHLFHLFHLHMTD